MRQVSFCTLVVTSLLFGQTGQVAAQKLRSIDVVSLSFTDLTHVLPAETHKPSIKMVVNTFHTENRTRMVAVNKFRTETRTRTVIVEGKEVAKPYTVQVPYVEQVQQEYSVSVPTATQKTTVPISELTAWSIDGRKIEQDDLVKRLAKPTYIFLMKKPWPKRAALAPAQKAVIRADALLVHAPSIQANQPRQPKVQR